MTAPGSAASFNSNHYDEFQFLELHARWAGLPSPAGVSVERAELSVEGRRISLLRWGSADPGMVLLHGSGQNAHTWDTFALALGRPCLAIDLPGHGRSEWRPDGDYFPGTTAPAVAHVVAELAPAGCVLVGMSLGGLTGLRVATTRPGLIKALVLVDITPGLPEIPHRDRLGRPMTLSLMSGPRRFASWDDMVEAAHAAMPHRPREAVVPGVRHNARRFDDGTWGWRYDSMRSDVDPRPALDALWQDLEHLRAPVMLVRGELSPIVTEDAIAELRRRVPTVRIELVAGAGHSVQTDQPVELARLVHDFVP